MNSYFNTNERRAQLVNEALRWVNTPFVPHAKVCGAGVDCVNLCAQIYIACGLLTEFNAPAYGMDGGKHNAESQLTAWLDAHPKFAKLDEANPQPGDLLCFKIGKSAHHAGLVTCWPRFVHCLYQRKVMVGTMTDRTFQRILHSIYRPVT